MKPAPPPRSDRSSFRRFLEASKFQKLAHVRIGSNMKRQVRSNLNRCSYVKRRKQLVSTQKICSSSSPLRKMLQPVSALFAKSADASREFDSWWRSVESTEI